LSATPSSYTFITSLYPLRAGNANVAVSAGYKENAIKFGWTNAVYLKMREIAREVAASPLAGPAALAK
jgi:alpha,alpha-trehalase